MNMLHSSHNPHKTPLVKCDFFNTMSGMKTTAILFALLCALCFPLSFAAETPATVAQKDKELFDFSVTAIPPTTTVVETPKVLEKVVPEVKTEVKTETSSTTIVPSATASTPAALVADAQTLIKDKLVQKYQVRLDEVISRMTSRLATVSAEEQRIALTDLRDRIAEKKTLVVTKEDLEPLKRDIILAILDHVMYRLDGLLKQSAQTPVDEKWAA